MDAPKWVLPRKTDPLAEDECDLHLLAVLRAMWPRVGHQQPIRTPGQNRKRGVEFIAFLARLLGAYPQGPLYVLVDDASIRTSHAVRKRVAQHPRLELVYLPTYSGHHLNPVEKVWWALKAHIAANRSFKTAAELDRAIQRFFAGFTGEDALRLANSEVTRAAQAAILESAENLS